MSTTSVTGLTVVPAYRVVAHFVKQVRKLPESESLDSLEQKVRHYVRNSLSPLHGSYAEIGERWAVTQLGDPDLDILARALQVAEATAPRRSRKRCAGALSSCPAPTSRHDSCCFRETGKASC